MSAGFAGRAPTSGGQSSFLYSAGIDFLRAIGYTVIGRCSEAIGFGAVCVIADIWSICYCYWGNIHNIIQICASASTDSDDHICQISIFADFKPYFSAGKFYKFVLSFVLRLLSNINHWMPAAIRLH